MDKENNKNDIRPDKEGKSKGKKKQTDRWGNPLPAAFIEAQFKKGQSGNPAGRPPGKSLKEFAREFLELATPEQKIEFLKRIPPEVVWKMAEGNPQNDVTSGGKPIQGNAIQFSDFEKDGSTTES